MKYTLKDLRKIGNSIGMTIRWSHDWQEYQVYPKGTGVEHPTAYFTTCREDAVDTAMAMVGGVKQ